MVDKKDCYLVGNLVQKKVGTMVVKLVENLAGLREGRKVELLVVQWGDGMVAALVVKKVAMWE